VPHCMIYDERGVDDGPKGRRTTLGVSRVL
jgi:hypothetical protein